MTNQIYYSMMAAVYDRSRSYNHGWASAVVATRVTRRLGYDVSHHLWVPVAHSVLIVQRQLDAFLTGRDHVFPVVVRPDAAE